jgi:hypothetical protein
MKLFLLGISIFVCIAFSSCFKPKVVPPSLPTETHEGKNTFGFDLNDQLWLPKSKGIDSGRALSSSIQYGFTLAATNLNQHIIFSIYGLSSTGSYDLTASGNSVLFIDNADHYHCTKGLMIVTYLDGVKGTVSGEFSATMVNDSENVLTIDQGRFDTTF